jgi:coiled-coil domain-containing protein 55
MSGEKAEKQYGLILPKSKLATTKVPAQQQRKVASVFNDDSSDDDDDDTKAVASGSTDWMKKRLSSGSSINAKSGATGRDTKIKAKTKLELQKAIKEDPTVFQYDEIYEDMVTAKSEKSAQSKDKERKPKYIQNLIKHAEIRTKENERRVERQVQKEREAEGDEFADKEQFVTSAYRKKMEEMQKLEEEERKQNAMETILDVTKQKDMSGFYRHIYRQTMGDEKGQKSSGAGEVIKEEVKEEPMEEQIPMVPSGVTDTGIIIEGKDVKMISKKTKPSQRSYRRKDDDDDKDDASEESSDDEESSTEGSQKDDIEDEKKVAEEEKQQRIDKDKLRKDELRQQKEKRDRRKRRIQEGRDTSSEEEEDEEEEEEEEEEDEEDDEEVSKKVKTSSVDDKENIEAIKAKQPKRDIWKKRTIGKVFEDTLQRYLIRKSERFIPW